MKLPPVEPWAAAQPPTVGGGRIWDGGGSALLGAPPAPDGAQASAPTLPRDMSAMGGASIDMTVVGGAPIGMSGGAPSFSMGSMGGSMGTPMGPPMGERALGLGGVALEASVAERAALAVLDDFTDTFNLENAPPSPQATCPSPQASGAHSTATAAAPPSPNPTPTDTPLIKTDDHRLPRLALSAKSRGAAARGIPEDLLCPISHELMVDPVLAADGHAYERAHIDEWLTRSHTSPLTGEPLANAHLLPCHAIRKMAEAWR